MRDATLPAETPPRFGADGAAPRARGDVIPLPVRRRGENRFGEFEVLAPLARGGMGGVYLAAHRETGERVALKVLDPAFAGNAEVCERLRGEHALASRTTHPGLVEIRDARVSQDDVPYLVMEYLRGETLGELAERGPIEQATVIAICAQVASALAAFHAAGAVHCDVKHDNVFVLDAVDERGRPRVKVIDFGVSCLVRDGGDDAVATIAGTPWCMAPEQWRGEPGPASDVYALGCLLYDLLTGHPPFDGSLPELMLAHLEQRPARPSWLVKMPTDLERLILRSLAKDPAHRPSMAEVAAELTVLSDAASTTGASGDLRAVG
ncbi:MAG: serine/threonine protein kinase [Deltaproteobacteria bacterium]|nr:serine/threonine protein kinase [Deltaproteobacteria bacterium]